MIGDQGGSGRLSFRDRISPNIRNELEIYHRCHWGYISQITMKMESCWHYFVTLAHHIVLPLNWIILMFSMTFQKNVSCFPNQSEGRSHFLPNPRNYPLGGLCKLICTFFRKRPAKPFRIDHHHHRHRTLSVIAFPGTHCGLALVCLMDNDYNKAKWT